MLYIKIFQVYKHSLVFGQVCACFVHVQNTTIYDENSSHSLGFSEPVNTTTILIKERFFTQQEFCNNTLKGICWFALRIRNWYMPLRCIHGYKLAYLYILYKCCYLRGFVTHVKYIYACIIFLFYNEKGEPARKWKIRYSFNLSIKRKYVYSMPSEKNQLNKNPTKKPTPKPVRCSSLNIANVKWDYRNIHLWLNHQLFISINIYCPVERLCYALLWTVWTCFRHSVI